MFDFLSVSRYAYLRLKGAHREHRPIHTQKDAAHPDESTLTDRQRKVLGAIKSIWLNKVSPLRSAK